MQLSSSSVRLCPGLSSVNTGCCGLPALLAQSLSPRGGLGSLLILWPRDSQAGELGHPEVSPHCFLIPQLHCLYCLRSSGLRTVVSCVLPVFLVVGDRRVNRVCYIYLDWKQKSLTHGFRTVFKDHQNIQVTLLDLSTKKINNKFW